MAVVSAVDVLQVDRGPLRRIRGTHAADVPLWERGTLTWLLNAVAVLGLSLGLWALCLNLFKRHNDFPTYYHPDEYSKGEQIVEDRRNFNHPQLMLEGALLLMPTPKTGSGSLSAPPMGGDVNRIVVEGRNTSAAFAAGAAVLMAWAGWAAAGWVGFLGLGLAIGLCPALLSHAHYFKEDATLVFGVAAVMCAGAWALRVRGAGATVWMLIALGVAAGLASSGKYCGMVMVVPAILISVVAVRRNGSLMMAAPLIVLAFSAVTWAGVNYRVFNDFDHFVQNFDGEKEHSTTEHQGLTMDKPTWFFANAVWTEAMPHIKVLTVAAAIVLPWMILKRRRWGFGFWLGLSTAIYLVMLAYSVIPFYRYALPATVMLYAFAAMGVAWLSTLPPRPWMRAVVAGVGLTVIGVTQGYRCADFTQQFADDSREALRDWARIGFPAGATVIVDNYATPFLSDSPVRVMQGIRAGNPVEGTIEQLRQRGVEFVVTCSSNSDRFLSPYVIGVQGNELQVQQMRSFYTDLSKYPVVWERVAKHPMWNFSNPDVRVYRLDPLK
ncbi:MAG: hypothetical protein JWM57_436 [Phycisphaerales bacterium]|nr:hypothetical protein [Phycisphaerales bacterium]